MLKKHFSTNFFVKKNRTAHAVRGKFSEVYIQLKGAYALQKISMERKIFRGPHTQYDFFLEKIVLRMRSAENFPFRRKLSEVYIQLNIWTR